MPWDPTDARQVDLTVEPVESPHCAPRTFRTGSDRSEPKALPAADPQCDMVVLTFMPRRSLAPLRRAQRGSVVLEQRSGELDWQIDAARALEQMVLGQPEMLCP